MNKRNRHVGKSPAARESYYRYLKNIDCEPTVDDQIALSPSTEAGEELCEPTTTRRRKISAGRQFKDHISEHWIEWLFGVGVVVAVWFMVDARIDMACVETNVDTHKGNISDLQADVQKGVDKNQEQDLTLREHQVRLTAVEDKIKTVRK